MNDPSEISVASIIEGALKDLVGLRMALAFHAGNMRGFSFGNVYRRKGRFRGGYSLHISCPWRIDDGSRVITGFHDWYEQENPDAERDDDWYPDKGGTLQEAKLRRLFKDERTPKGIVNRTNALRVTKVHADSVGGCDIFLSPRYRLAIFPAASCDEYWRLFRARGKHFVVEAEKVGYHRCPSRSSSA